jgi:hypothetical protein
LLADDGNNGLDLFACYDGSMPGWQFNKTDQFYGSVAFFVIQSMIY